MTTIKECCEAARTVYRASPREFYSQMRHRDLAHARFAAMFLCRSMTRASLPAIGHLLGRDHTTVMYGVRRARGLVRDDYGFAKKMEQARRLVSRVDEWGRPFQ